MNYTNEALTRLAKGAPCQLESIACSGGPETSVWAHSNLLRHGKGRGIKAHDYFGAILCAGCHMWLDQGPASREEKEAAFYVAFERTVAYLWQNGLIQVTGKPQKEKAPKPLSKIIPHSGKF